nr:MAG TPA: hypothetical protein [Caudoviricetes sp.]
MAGGVAGGVLHQSGHNNFVFQQHAVFHAAGGLGLLTEIGFLLGAVVHAGSQVVLFQRNGFPAVAVQHDYIAVGTDGAAGFVFLKRGFAVGGEFDDFGFHRYHREHRFGDKAVGGVALRHSGQNGGNALQFFQIVLTHGVSPYFMQRNTACS